MTLVAPISQSLTLAALVAAAGRRASVTGAT